MHLIIEPFCLPHVDVLIKILNILQHKFFSFILGMHFIFLWIAWVVSSGYSSSYITLMDILKHLPWKYPCIDRESFFIAAENQECLSEDVEYNEVTTTREEEDNKKKSSNFGYRKDDISTNVYIFIHLSHRHHIF